MPKRTPEEMVEHIIDTYFDDARKQGVLIEDKAIVVDRDGMRGLFAPIVAATTETVEPMKAALRSARDLLANCTLVTKTAQAICDISDRDLVLDLIEVALKGPNRDPEPVPEWGESLLRSIWRNKKNGKAYQVYDVITNKTEGEQDGDAFVCYREVGQPGRYCRSEFDFRIKFEKLTEVATERGLSIDEAEAEGKLHPVFAQDARNLGYSSYESYLDEECK